MLAIGLSELVLLTFIFILIGPKKFLAIVTYFKDKKKQIDDSVTNFKDQSLIQEMQEKIKNIDNFEDKQIDSELKSIIEIFKNRTDEVTRPYKHYK